MGIDTFKMREKSWRFHEGYTYWGKSTEKLIVKVSNGTRSWHSITHLEHARIGGWILGVAEFINVKMLPHVIIGDSGTSYMEAKYKVRLKPAAYLGEFDSDYMYSYATWNTMFNMVSESN